MASSKLAVEEGVQLQLWDTRVHWCFSVRLKPLHRNELGVFGCLAGLQQCPAFVACRLLALPHIRAPFGKDSPR